jgi:hypothetical protein
LILEELRGLQELLNELPLRLELPDLEDFEVRDGLEIVGKLCVLNGQNHVYAWLGPRCLDVEVVEGH